MNHPIASITLTLKAAKEEINWNDAKLLQCIKREFIGMIIAVNESSIIVNKREWSITLRYSHNPHSSACHCIFPSTLITLLPNNEQGQEEKCEEPLEQPNNDYKTKAEKRIIETIDFMIVNKKSSNKVDIISSSFLLTGPAGVGKSFTVSKITKKYRKILDYHCVKGASDIKQAQSILKKKSINNRKLSLLFLDELDAMMLHNTFVLELCEFIDTKSTNTIIIGATNHVENIPANLRRSGRFDTEINLSPPNVEERFDLLRTLVVQNDTLSIDELLEISKKSIGYTPADLVFLIRRSLILSNEKLTKEVIESVMTQIHPSLLRKKATVIFSSPNIATTTKQELHGSLNGAKQKLLQQAIHYPITKAKSFQRLNLSTPKGILLFGPPGCGKTSLAKLAASSNNIAFLSLSPANVYASSYVGEAERIIREYFQLGYSLNSPCLLFFDEIDAILGGGGGGKDKGSPRGTSIGTRMLSTFLNEMDGVDAKNNNNLLILGATNQPHLLDSALLRPGRFDQILYVPPPDVESRRDMFASFIRKYNNSHELDEKLVDYLTIMRSEDMTSAEIQSICQDAAYLAFRERSEILTQDHFDFVLKDFCPLLIKEPMYLKQYELFERDHGRG